MTDSGPRRPTKQDLVRWSEALAGIAKTGLGFTESLYEQERFQEVLAVAADIAHAAGGDDFDHDLVIDLTREGAAALAMSLRKAARTAVDSID